MPLEEGPFLQMLLNLIRNLDLIHIPSLCLSSICILILFTLKQLKSRYVRLKYFPSAVFIIIFGIIVSYFTRSRFRFNVIGALQSGLPSPTNFLDQICVSSFTNLFPSSMLIALIGFTQSYTMTKRCADLRSYYVNASQGILCIFNSVNN